MSNISRYNDSNVAQPGALYIVATPIGNLSDISVRAIEVLKSVDFIAAEDTRHSGKLLDKYSVRTKMVSFHEHNEARKVQFILNELQAGKQIALVSDAGTPLMSDPGYSLVKAVHDAGFRVIPIPGPCAMIAALSASALPTDRFIYAGFLPAKQSARVKALEAYGTERRTVVFYESSHRIRQALEDMGSVLGMDRPLTLARELTKQYESICAGTIGSSIELLLSDTKFLKGEFVLVLGGAEPPEDLGYTELDELLDIVLTELSVSRSADLLARVTGQSRRTIYQRALARKK